MSDENKCKYVVMIFNENDVKWEHNTQVMLYVLMHYSILQK